MRDGPKAGYVAKPNVNTEIELQKWEQIEREQNHVRTILERLDPELIISAQSSYQFAVKPTWTISPKTQVFNKA